jgi:hypothetical protein
VGLLTEPERATVAARIAAWLADLGVSEIHYKPHPREGHNAELSQWHYQVLAIDEPLESYLARNPYAVVAGCCSTGLYTARQVMGAQTRIAAFGFDKVHFKTPQARDELTRLSTSLRIERPDGV